METFTCLQTFCNQVLHKVVVIPIIIITSQHCVYRDENSYKSCVCGMICDTFFTHANLGGVSNQLAAQLMVKCPMKSKAAFCKWQSTHGAYFKNCIIWYCWQEWKTFTSPFPASPRSWKWKHNISTLFRSMYSLFYSSRGPLLFLLLIKPYDLFYCVFA